MRLAVLGTRIGRIGAAAIALLLLAGALWVYATGWRPSAARYPIQGVDVSDDSGAIDWNMLAAHQVDFAYIEATAGADVRDATFAANWDAAAAAGIRRGAIHRWSFCRDGAAQADNFVTTVPRTADALPAALAIGFSADCDARPGRADLIADIDRFLRIAETHTGEPMLIRITRPVERAYGLSTAVPRPLWEARDFLAPRYTARPWRIWRASDVRRVEGAPAAIGWDVVAP